MKKSFLLLLLQLALIFTLSEAKSSTLPAQADKSFNITYIQVVFHLKQQSFMFGFSVICLWINQSFVVLVFWFWNLECDKLFLHGCYNNKLFFLQIHAWSDQYFFWWRLWQSGSFFHFQSFLNFISLILMIFIFWIIIFGLWYSLKFALSLKHYRKMIPNFAIDECFFLIIKYPIV